MTYSGHKSGKINPAELSQKTDTIRSVWEVADRGDRILTDWKISGRMRGKLQAKVDMLRRAEVGVTGKVALPEGMCAGPKVWGQKWIYKLIVNGEEALRPMFCLGPKVLAAEWTFLVRATERDRDTRAQKAAASAASVTRQAILDGISLRVRLADPADPEKP
jgi:hypothetical protein